MPKGNTLAQQFAALCAALPDHCVPWTGCKGRLGYGLAWDGRKLRPAHRLVYEMVIGPIPDGLTLDHLCKNPPCVNPRHLEPVTLRENLRRGDSHVGLNARKTHCKHGHEFTPENTFLTPNGGRRCRTCKRAAYRAYYEANKSRRAATHKARRHRLNPPKRARYRAT